MVRPSPFLRGRQSLFQFRPGFFFHVVTSSEETKRIRLVKTAYFFPARDLKTGPDGCLITSAPYAPGESDVEKLPQARLTIVTGFEVVSIGGKGKLIQVV